jgi:hypothetical protein
VYSPKFREIFGFGISEEMLWEHQRSIYTVPVVVLGSIPPLERIYPGPGPPRRLVVIEHMGLSNSEHRAKKEIPAIPMTPVKQYEYPSPTLCILHLHILFDFTYHGSRDGDQLSIAFSKLEIQSAIIYIFFQSLR